jgi:hypothetical protein
MITQDGAVESQARRRAALRRLLGTRGWALPLLVFLLLLAIYAATARHGGGSWDYYTGNYAAWNLVHTGHAWLDGSTMPGLEGNPQAATWIRADSDGHTIIRRFPGVIAITLPAYWIAQANQMTVVPAARTAAAVTAGAITLMFLALRRLVPVRHALVVCAVLGLATPVWTVAADALWSHTVCILGIAGMAWASATSRWWLVGVFGGVTLWGRLHAAFIVAVLGVTVGWVRRSPRITAVVGLWSLACLGLFSVWTKWWNGSWSPMASYGSDVINEVAVTGWHHLSSVLTLFVAADRGIFLWTPVFALLLPAVVRGWSDVPDWARGLLFGSLAYVLLQGWIGPGHGGDSFYGYRYSLELIVGAAPAYAVTAPHMGRVANAAIVPVVALQFSAFAFGSVTDMFLTMDDVWTHNTFVVDMAKTWPIGPALVLPCFLFALLVGLRVARWLGDDASASQSTVDPPVRRAHVVATSSD